MYENPFLKVIIGIVFSESFKNKGGISILYMKLLLFINIDFNSILDNIKPFKVEQIRYGLKEMIFKFK